MVDFHSHLDLHTNPKAVVAECESRRLRILSVTTTPRAWHGTIALVKNHELIFTALGIHPQLAFNFQLELDLFKKLLPETRFVGEIGIDGSREFKTNIDQQIQVFQSILKECEVRGGRILSIHSRNSASLVLDELEMTLDNNVPILHWFSGNLTELERAIALDCWFSIGPAMFYSSKGKQLIQRMPPNRILTETDSPFVQLQGKRLMPWDIETHHRHLSDLLGLDILKTVQLIEENCDSLLQKIR